MRLGYIDYLNCYPFYHDMMQHNPIEGVEVVPDYPEGLNRMLASGELDASPVSAAACAEMIDDICILPGFCLSSVGYVRSVVLYSALPMEELNGKKVGLTSASRTSVILLRLLLEEYYGLDPEYVTVPPDADMTGLDAQLVIGNEAMLECSEPIQYSYDLGDLWMRRTGHPVVFALFAVRRDFLAQNRKLLEGVIESYNRSLAHLENNETGVVVEAMRRYPHIRYDIHHYYELLKFRMNDRLVEALQFYYDRAADRGLLPTVKDIPFLGGFLCP